MSDRTLIVAPNWIGDAVMSQPLLALLKQRAPLTPIDVLAPKFVMPVYQRMAEVDGGIDLPFGHGAPQLKARREFARQLQHRYARTIVLPNSFKSALIPWMAKIPVRTGWSGEMRFGILNDRRTLNEQALPRMVERYAALAYSKDEPLPDTREWAPRPTLQIDADARAATLIKFALNTSKPIAAFCPGAEYGPAKRWPTHHFAELARTLEVRGYEVWLLGGPKDQAITQEIAALSHGAVRDLAGKTTLSEAIDLLSVATVVVTNDSGLMHVAAALDRPIAAIYGSSSPTFTPPLTPKAEIIRLELPCSPCFKRECPLKHMNCLNELEPQRVLQVVLRSQ